MIHNRRTLKNKPTKKIIVGKIYADWCGHCIALKPEWDKMKSQIKKSHIEFIEIEASETTDLEKFENQHNTKIQVNGYPTIFKITEHVEYYQGPRDANNLQKWALSNNKRQGGSSRKNKKSKRKTIKQK